MEQEITKQATDGTMSEGIGKLAAALNKAQATIETAKRASENPFFHSNYADLESVWNACREALTENGLSVAQTMSGTPDNLVVVTTLMHTSGEWIRGKLALKPVKNDPQAVGSAITYGRRYSLAAIVGVVPENEDDDGNAASGRGGASAPKAKAQAQASTPNAPPVTHPPSHAEGEQSALLTLGEVGTRTGQSAKGEWTRYFVKADDGQYYSTFDRTLGEKLDTLSGETVQMVFDVKQTARGEQRTIISVEPEIDGNAEQGASDKNREHEQDADDNSELPF